MANSEEIKRRIEEDPDWYEEIRAKVKDKEQGIIWGPMILFTTYKVLDQYRGNFDVNNIFKTKEHIGKPCLYNHGRVLLPPLNIPFMMPEERWPEIQIGTWTNVYIKFTSRCRALWGEFTLNEKSKATYIDMVEREVCGFSVSGNAKDALVAGKNQVGGTIYDFKFKECSLCDDPMMFILDIPKAPTSVKVEEKPLLPKRKRPI